MKKRQIPYLLLLFCLSFFTVSIYSQISQQGFDYDEYNLTYGSDTLADPVFVIYSPNLNGEKVTSINGTLSATHSSNDTSVFIWQKFNTSTLSFDTIQIDSNRRTSVFNDPLKLGCYRVSITDTSDSNEVYSVWTHIDHVQFNIFPNFKISNICWELLFKAVYNIPVFYYYHIYDTVQITLDSVNNETIVSIEIEGETPFTEILKKDYSISTYGENKEIYFRCTDLFENKRAYGYYYYESWIPVIRDEVTDSHTGLSDGTDIYFAPDEVTFNINGSNYDSIIWLFGDTITPFKDDSTFTGYFVNTYKYMKPGNYTAKFIAKNTIYGCQDRDSIYFEIVSSSIDSSAIPNSFTPNGDNINDVWIVEGKSIRNFNLRIYDRWGRVVFKNELTDYQALDEGDESNKKALVTWDGRNTVAFPNRDCPTGVYFYIIEAEGWDGNIFGGKKKSPNENNINISDKESSSKTSKTKKYPFSGVIYLFR